MNRDLGGVSREANEPPARHTHLLEPLKEHAHANWSHRLIVITSGFLPSSHLLQTIVALTTRIGKYTEIPVEAVNHKALISGTVSACLLTRPSGQILRLTSWVDITLSRFRDIAISRRNRWTKTVSPNAKTPAAYIEFSLLSMQLNWVNSEHLLGIPHHLVSWSLAEVSVITIHKLCLDDTIFALFSV